MQQKKAVSPQSGTFPAILKQERALRGWSQADVAARIGSDPKTVGRWERGLTVPGPYLCQRLTELYGKTLQELGLVKDYRPSHLEDKEFSENDASTEASPDHAVMLQEATQERAKPAPVAPFEEWGSEAAPASEQKRTVKRPMLFLGLASVFVLSIALGIWLPSHRSDPRPAATPSPSNPYLSKGVLALNEKLTANSAAGWSLNQNDQGQCFFAGGSYRIRDIQNGFMEVCLANETYFTNFTYEIKMTIVAGDCGGLAFRTTFPQLYYFLACRDGRYRFVRYDKNNPANTRIIAQGISSALHQGLKVMNVLAVVAIDTTFAISVNHLVIVRATDGAYLDGQIGTIAHTCRMVYSDPRPNLCDAPTEVAFNDARVWV